MEEDGASLFISWPGDEQSKCERAGDGQCKPGEEQQDPQDEDGADDADKKSEERDKSKGQLYVINLSTLSLSQF